VNTIKRALNDAYQQLQIASPSPAADASCLLCHVLDCNSAHLIAWPDKELTPPQAAEFADILQRRLTGEPIAYITGVKEFWSLSLKINQDVLIPRPETETLVEFVLDRFAGRSGMKIADLGTGSGAIACALAVEHPQWDIVATDISPTALQIARANAEAFKLDNIRFRRGSWFEAIADECFDLIVSNPPYVAEDDPHLTEGDVRFEPEFALAAGGQGLDAIRILSQQAGGYLQAGGWLVVEHGYDQRLAVQACFVQAGFDEIVQLTDLASLPRVTAGRFSD
jgi:release factor glutamine methyltransferase